MKIKPEYLLATLLLGASLCFAYPHLYGPFEKGEQVKLFPMVECQLVQSDSSNFVDTKQFFRYQLDYLRLNISTGENGNQIALINLNQPSKPLFQSGDLDISLMLASTVRWGYLNEDHAPDYIIEAWTGGNGLAASFCYVLFLLSDGNHYAMQKLMTVTPGPEDFVDLNKDGICEYIHTAFVYGEAGKDSKIHNYWCYSILQFEQDKLVIKNQIDERFPKWVMYSNNENHEATKQLIDEQKIRLLSEQHNWLTK